MKSTKRVLFFAVLTAVLLAVPAAVFANKQIFRARLLTTNELHEVVGSNARGAAVFGFAPGDVPFQLTVNNLSGNPTGVHIHGPASTTENGPVVVTLCGNPAPAVLGPCPPLDSNGSFKLDGVIGNHLQPGVTNAQFQDWIQGGLLYVNVHTSLNPAGEVRGNLFPQ